MTRTRMVNRNVDRFASVSLSLSIAREFEWAIVPIILFTVLVGHNSFGLKYNSSTRGNERLAERNVKGNFL